MKRPIYLDYAATTPVDERVMHKMMQYMGMADNFGNPASGSHVFGWEAEEAVEQARRQVAHLIKATPREIIWTSGATESDNLAIKGVAHFYKKRGNHIITVKSEHKAVLDSARQLEREGFNITWLQVQADGLLDLEQLAQAITEQTLLVSVMHVNNETGVMQDIKAISQLTRARKVFLHVDAAQSAGTIPLDVDELDVDLLSISAHKMYGPKGIGALYVRRSPKVRLEPLIHGGGHEQGLRSGTLPTHQIVGMGEAATMVVENLDTESRRITALREKLWQGLQQLDAVYLNGHPSQRSPGHLNVSFGCVEGEALLMGLQDVAVSSGSACTSTSIEPSYVLQAMGVDAELAQSALRFCIGRYTTEQDIEHTVEHVMHHVQRLRNMSPLWQVHDPKHDQKKKE